MGTNYFWRDGTHIAKTSAVGGGKFKIFWAQLPVDVLNHEKTALVLDEYGHEMTLEEFWAKLTPRVEDDTSTIGEEFS